MGNSVSRLQIELQAASRGWFTWDDVLMLTQVFPYFNKMYFQHNGISMWELRDKMCNEGYKISYKAYMEMFLDLTEQFRYNDPRLWEEIVFG